MQTLTIDEHEPALEPLCELDRQILALLETGDMTRGQLVGKLGTPRTTIYEGLRRLILRNRVTKYPCHAGNRGRPKVLFHKIKEE